MNIQELKKTANQVRKNIITAVYYAKAGHPGGSLSAAEIFPRIRMIPTGTGLCCPRDTLAPGFTA